MSSLHKTAHKPDALSSDQNTFQLPLRRFRHLAPKPLPLARPRLGRPSTGTSVSSVFPASRPFACPVCGRVWCQLKSHKAFAQQKELEWKIADADVSMQHRRTLPKDTTYQRSYAYLFAQHYVDPDIAASQVDPFINLPIPDNANLEIHRLFHDCKLPFGLPYQMPYSLTP
jgi:hypothetical protein